MRTLTCGRCNQPFDTSSSQARFCGPCRPLHDREQKDRWWADHPGAQRASRRRWRIANPELNEAVAKRWRDGHPQKLAEYRSTSKRRNPVANRSYVRVRKARQRGLAVIPFTAAQLRDRLSMFGGRCWMCGSTATTIDHVKPLAAGGGHLLANLRPACSECNGRKGHRWPFEAAA